MSIQSEISRLADAKHSIAQAIMDKGVAVPSGTTLDEFPTYIGQIQMGSGVGEKLGTFNTQGGVIDTPIKFGNRSFSCLVAISDSFTCAAVATPGPGVANNTWISTVYSSSAVLPAAGWLTFQRESGNARMTWVICPDGSMSDRMFTLYGIG